MVAPDLIIWRSTQDDISVNFSLHLTVRMSSNVIHGPFDGLYVFELEAEVVDEWRIQLAHQCLKVFQSMIMVGMVVLVLFLQVVPSKV